jgi:hypothetical protein
MKRKSLNLHYLRSSYIDALLRVEAVLITPHRRRCRQRLWSVEAIFGVTSGRRFVPTQNATLNREPKDGDIIPLSLTAEPTGCEINL